MASLRSATKDMQLVVVENNGVDRIMVLIGITFVICANVT